VLRERILAIYEAVHGADHPDLAEAILALGVLSLQMQDRVRPRAYLIRALPLVQVALGENHPSVIAVHELLKSIHL